MIHTHLPRQARVALAIILLAACMIPPARAGDDCPKPITLVREQVSVSGPSGVQTYTVEIADTRAAREAGLMCRPDLAERQGMLLLYVRPQMVTVWMKNTRIPLDLLFIAADGRIVKLASAKPGSLRRIGSDVPVLGVLELKAGSVARDGIRMGDVLRRQKQTNVD
jgi:uncharacterized membrane protein (UPF0127 family)